MPARSTTSNVAGVVFFGLNSALSRSTRSSGTRAIPACISARAPSNDEVATLCPVRRLNSEVFPLRGSPISPIFMRCSCYHAAIMPGTSRRDGVVARASVPGPFALTITGPA